MEAANKVEVVLSALETARKSMGMSKAELARRGRVPAETVRRLLTSKHANPHFAMLIEILRPAGLGLFVGKLAGPTDELAAAPELVQAWLAHLGAPLYGSTAVVPSDVPPPERVLAEGLCLARRESNVARALPVAFHQVRQRLNFDLLRRLAAERRQERVLGFFLDLTSELSGDESLAREARPLAVHVRGRKRASQFFKVHSATERRLAEMKTPPAARRWGFRMNMSQDSFSSTFHKASAISS